MATMSRPVYARARRTAPSTARDPSLQNLTISMVGMSRRNCSAHSTSIGAGREKLVPWASSRPTASTTGGNACPSVTARSPMPYSMNSFPSVSHTWHPRPRSMNAGACSGNWSSPLAYVWAPPGITSLARRAMAAAASERRYCPPAAAFEDSLREAIFRPPSASRASVLALIDKLPLGCRVVVVEPDQLIRQQRLVSSAAIVPQRGAGARLVGERRAAPGSDIRGVHVAEIDAVARLAGGVRHARVHLRG